MSNALGWGLGLQNLQQALAQMLAYRQQNAMQAKEDTFRTSQLDEQRRQFDQSQAQSQSQFTTQMDRAAAQDRARTNQFGLEQMERDRITAARQQLTTDP